MGMLQGLPAGCQRDPCMPMRSVVEACVRLTPAAGMHTCVHTAKYQAALPVLT